MCVCVHVLQLNVLVDEKHPELSNGVWGWACVCMCFFRTGDQFPKRQQDSGCVEIHTL